jgi:hypothetical protein
MAARKPEMHDEGVRGSASVAALCEHAWGIPLLSVGHMVSGT